MNNPTQTQKDRYKQAVAKTVIITIAFAALPVYLFSIASAPWSQYLTLSVLLAGCYAAAYVKKYRAVRGLWWIVVCLAGALWPSLLTAAPTFWHLPLGQFGAITAGMIFAWTMIAMSAAWFFERMLPKKRGKNDQRT